MHGVDGRAGLDHERQVLQPRPLGAVGAAVGRRVEEQKRARLAARRPVRELVAGAQERLEADQRHQGVVVPLGRAEVRHVDPQVTEHTPTLTGLRPLSPR